MFELKPLSREGISAALEKAVRYRLLNEPFGAESICRDVRRVDPDDRDALVTLILALTDQFGSDGGASVSDAQKLLPELQDEYDREYYAGIVCERRGQTYVHRLLPGTGPIAYDWLRRAMQHYERAEALRPEGNDDAILRWNSCARVIMRHRELEAAEAHPAQMMLE